MFLSQIGDCPARPARRQVQARAISSHGQGDSEALCGVRYRGQVISSFNSCGFASCRTLALTGWAIVAAAEPQDRTSGVITNWYPDGQGHLRQLQAGNPATALKSQRRDSDRISFSSSLLWSAPTRSIERLVALHRFRFAAEALYP